MEKTIVIDGREVCFKSTGATPLRYKAQFKKDYLAEIIKLSSLERVSKKNATAEDFEGLDFEVFYNVIWVLAKTADPNIKDPITWLDTFDSFPIMELLPELMDLVTSSIKTKKK